MGSILIRIAESIWPLRRTRPDVRAVGPEIDGEERSRLQRRNSVQSPAGSERSAPSTSGCRDTRKLVRTVADEAMAMIEAGQRTLGGHGTDVLRQIVSYVVAPGSDASSMASDTV